MTRKGAGNGWSDAERSARQRSVDFAMRVLRATAFDLCDCMFWRCDGEYAPITFLVNCSDTFWWASADAENLTPENVDLFEQSLADVVAVTGDKYDIHGPILFCCRARKMRPMECAYPEDKRLWPLFDDAGPERPVGSDNPRKVGRGRWH